MDDLKIREKAILDYMKEQIAVKGYPPTVREICSALNIKSTSTVHKDLANLEKKGYVVKDPAKPRAIMLNSADSHAPVSPKVNASDDTVEIPVLGRVAAGTPILAQENVEDFFSLPARFVNGDENFMLRVRGESMIEVGIFDGDYILVEKRDVARNGEIVVAMIDGFEAEATVKTFYKEDGHIRLQPENSEMSPIIVSDVKILGKVKGVFRYLS